VGAGTIDFLKIVKALKKCGYDDTATLEIFTEDRRLLKKSRDRFDEILKSR
jgi:sugar phosphate isomerase/epimerase